MMDYAPVFTLEKQIDECLSRANGMNGMMKQ